MRLYQRFGVMGSEEESGGLLYKIQQGGRFMVYSAGRDGP